MIWQEMRMMIWQGTNKKERTRHNSQNSKDWRRKEIKKKKTSKLKYSCLQNPPKKRRKRKKLHSPKMKHQKILIIFWMCFLLLSGWAAREKIMRRRIMSIPWNYWGRAVIRVGCQRALLLLCRDLQIIISSLLSNQIIIPKITCKLLCRLKMRMDCWYLNFCQFHAAIFLISSENCLLNIESKLLDIYF